VVLLEPIVDLRVAVTPPEKGSVLWCNAGELRLTTSFPAVAQSCELDARGHGSLGTVAKGARIMGVALCRGMAPRVFYEAVAGGEVRLPLERGSCVRVALRGPDGGPLANARVLAKGRLAELDGFPWTQESRSGADGVAEVCGIPPGAFVLELAAKGMATQREELQAEAGRLDAGTVEFEKGVEITGRVVTADDQPVPRARVVAGDVEAKTGNVGEFTLAGLKPGPVRVQVNALGFIAADPMLVEAPSSVVLRLERGARVRWAIDNAPLTGDVAVEWIALDAEGRRSRSSRGDWDREQRQATASNLPPGRYRLTARAPGVAPVESEVFELETAGELALGPSRFERGLGVRGTVVHRGGGSPAIGARIKVEPGSPAAFRTTAQATKVAETICDALGEFELFGLEGTSYRLWVMEPGFAPFWRDAVTPDAEGKDLGTLELSSGFTLRGEVSRRSGEAISGVRVEIWEGKPFEFEPLSSTGSDERGQYLLEHMPNGHLLLRASADGKQAEKDIDGNEGATVTADLTLGGVKVRGQALFGDVPMAGGELVWTDARGAVSPDGLVLVVHRPSGEERVFGAPGKSVHAQVATDGSFTLNGLDAGAYRVTTVQRASSSTEVVVPDVDEATVLVRFPTGEVIGRTVDGEGRAVGGARVFAAAPQGNLLASSPSESDGSFHLPGLPPGSTLISATLGNQMEAAPIPVTVDEGRTTGPIDVVLKRKGEASLVGKLSASLGSVAGAPVALLGTVSRLRFCDLSGGVSFGGLPPGQYRVCARALGGAVGCGTPLTLGAGEEKEFSLFLGDAGRVLVMLPPEVHTPQLRFATADGIELTSLAFFGNLPESDGGSFVLGWFLPGDYVVSLPRTMRSQSVLVEVGRDTIVDLRH
jgi:hypothetical protein